PVFRRRCRSREKFWFPVPCLAPADQIRCSLRTLVMCNRRATSEMVSQHVVSESVHAAKGVIPKQRCNSYPQSAILRGCGTLPNYEMTAPSFCGRSSEFATQAL